MRASSVPVDSMCVSYLRLLKSWGEWLFLGSALIHPGTNGLGGVWVVVRLEVSMGAVGVVWVWGSGEGGWVQFELCGVVVRLMVGSVPLELVGMG